jgi:Flp pilus assembly protein protease CpaA
MILTLFIIISLIALIIASYTDIKTLEVPDWLSYSLIAIGVGGNLIYSIFSSDQTFIIRSLIGLTGAFILGMVMFYTGQWGGGDSKVLFGLGALLGLDYPFQLGLFPKFLINMLFAGGIYGIIWIIGMAVKNKKKVIKNLSKDFKEKNLARLRLYSGIAAIIGLIIIYLLPKFISSQIKITLMIMVCFLYFMNYLFIFIRTVEKVAMIKMIPPEKLTEGDWIVDEIKIKGKYITGPKDLGIEKEKIKELIALKKQGKIRKVKVKYGIPFVPSFLIALIYTIIFNNIVLFLFIR